MLIVTINEIDINTYIYILYGINQLLSYIQFEADILLPIPILLKLFKLLFNFEFYFTIIIICSFLTYA